MFLFKFSCLWYVFWVDFQTVHNTMCLPSQIIFPFCCLTLWWQVYHTFTFFFFSFQGPHCWRCCHSESFWVECCKFFLKFILYKIQTKKITSMWNGMNGIVSVVHSWIMFCLCNMIKEQWVQQIQEASLIYAVNLSLFYSGCSVVNIWWRCSQTKQGQGRHVQC